MAQNKIASLFYGGLCVRGLVWMDQAFAENLGQHAPEAVLRMHIKEAEFAAFGRRHCAEQENFAFRRPDRRERMGDKNAVGHGDIIA